MKKLLKITVGICIAVVVILLGLQIFLNHGLNPVVQNVLPTVSEKLGTKVSLGDVSINLFGGALTAEDAAVANPAGFEEPNILAVDRIGLDVSLPALLDRVVRVSDADIENAVFTLERNTAGDINLQKLQEQMPKSSATNAAPAETPPPAVAEQPKAEPAEQESVPEVPKFQLDNLAFNALFEYVDYKTANASPLRLGLDLKVAAQNVVTFGEKPENEWGTIAITGGLHEKPDTFTVDIIIRIAPLTDPATPSFKTEGKITAMNLDKLGDLSEEIGINSSSVDLTVNLNVEAGAFREGSRLVATVHDAKPTGKLKRKYKRVKLPSDLSITIPIAGSLAKPEIHIAQAVTTSILRNIKKNPDYLLENISVDGKPLGERLDKEINHGLNKLFHKKR